MTSFKPAPSTPAAGDHAAQKRFVHDALSRVASASETALPAALDAAFVSDAEVFAFHPVNALRGTAAIGDQLWAPLKTALPDLERRDTIIAGGSYRGCDMVAAMGCYYGTFTADWVGVPATGGVVSLRYGEVYAFENGRIRQAHILFDMLDLMRQAGVWPLAQSLGAEGHWPPPRGTSALQLDTVDAARGAESLALVKTMHAALHNFDGRSLRSMKHGHLWTPHFGWYGPAGIGAARGLKGFEVHHQIPFLTAFPNRGPGGHFISIGDGDVVVTGGWPSVVATHSGDGWLGLPATHKPVEMRVMDFYQCEGALIADNWVPIDIAHILLQLGYDVFARLKHLRGAPQQDLAGASQPATVL